MTAPAGNILIRPCSGHAEFEACVRLEVEIWGYEAEDTIPQREFVVIKRIGGQVLGAFDLAKSAHAGGDAPSMIGFAMSMPGIAEGRPYLHSHMLAVQPEYRNAGIGRKLKLAQRDDALARGIRLMEWTFDPLEIKNAYLNIARLGAVVQRYTPNFYGVFSSRLQAGLPSDRLHAEWLMDSPRVEATVKGGPVSLPEFQEAIVVPGAIRDWKQSASTLAQAETVQTEVRDRFLDAFARGLTVIGFTIGSSAYELKKSLNIGEDDGAYLLADG